MIPLHWKKEIDNKILRSDNILDFTFAKKLDNSNFKPVKEYLKNSVITTERIENEIREESKIFNFMCKADGVNPKENKKYDNIKQQFNDLKKIVNKNKFTKTLKMIDNEKSENISNANNDDIVIIKKNENTIKYETSESEENKSDSSENDEKFSKYFDTLKVKEIDDENNDLMVLKNKQNESNKLFRMESKNNNFLSGFNKYKAKNNKKAMKNFKKNDIYDSSNSENSLLKELENSNSKEKIIHAKKIQIISPEEEERLLKEKEIKLKKLKKETDYLKILKQKQKSGKVLMKTSQTNINSIFSGNNTISNNKVSKDIQNSNQNKDLKNIDENNKLDINKIDDKDELNKVSNSNKKIIIDINIKDQDKGKENILLDGNEKDKNLEINENNDNKNENPNDLKSSKSIKHINLQNMLNNGSINSDNKNLFSNDLISTTIDKNNKEYIDNLTYVNQLVKDTMEIPKKVKNLKNYLTMYDIKEDEFKKDLLNLEYLNDLIVGSVIFKQSKRQNNVFIILSGKVVFKQKTKNTFGNFDENIIGEAYEGFLFGDFQFLNTLKSNCSAEVAEENTQIIKIHKRNLSSSVFKKIIYFNIEIKVLLSKHFYILESTFFLSLLNKLVLSVYYKDEIIFREDQKAEYYYIIWHGSFKLTKMFKNSVRDIIEIRSRGVGIGKECFYLKNNVYRNSLVATSDFNMVYKIHYKLFDYCLPELSEYLLSIPDHINETFVNIRDNRDLYEEKYTVNYKQNIDDYLCKNRQKLIENTEKKNNSLFLRKLLKQSNLKRINEIELNSKFDLALIVNEQYLKSKYNDKLLQYKISLYEYLDRLELNYDKNTIDDIDDIDMLITYKEIKKREALHNKTKRAKVSTKANDFLNNSIIKRINKKFIWEEILQDKDEVNNLNDRYKTIDNTFEKTFLTNLYKSNVKNNVIVNKNKSKPKKVPKFIKRMMNSTSKNNKYNSGYDLIENSNIKTIDISNNKYLDKMTKIDSYSNNNSFKIDVSSLIRSNKVVELNKDRSALNYTLSGFYKRTKKGYDTGYLTLPLLGDYL